MKFELSARNFRPMERNTLRGFVDIHFDKAGLLVKSCTYHIKAEKEWIGLPGSPVIDKAGAAKRDAAGKISYANVVEITSDEAREAFRRDGVDAVKRLLAAQAA